MPQDFSKYTGSRTDDERREIGEEYVKGFEKKHGVSLGRNSGHRGHDHADRSHNHEFYGALDLDVRHLSPELREDLIMGAAGIGLRVVDEIDAKGRHPVTGKRRKRMVVHLDMAIREEIGNKRWSFSKNKEQGVDKAGTIRVEGWNKTYHVDHKRMKNLKINPDFILKTRSHRGLVGNPTDVSDPTAVASVDTDSIIPTQQELDVQEGTEIASSNFDAAGGSTSITHAPITLGVPNEPKAPTGAEVFQEAQRRIAQSTPNFQVDTSSNDDPESIPSHEVKPQDTQIEEEGQPYVPQEEFIEPEREPVRAASNELEVLEEADSFVTEDMRRTFQDRTPFSVEDKEKLGGRKADFSSTLEKIKEISLDPEGFDQDFENKLIDKNSVGLIMQNMMLAQETSGDIDPNYDPTKEEDVFKAQTENLDNEQLEEALRFYSNNRHDFITATSMMNAYNERKGEMQEFAQQSPVLSAVSTVGSVLTEAVIFAPVSTAIAASSASIGVKTLADLSFKSRLGYYAIGEGIEQGLQEVVWSSLDRDYEFDPLLFGLGMAAGVGLKKVTHNAEVDKVLRDIINNEEGFINLVTAEGKKTVDLVAKNAKDANAVALMNRLQDKVAVESNRLRVGILEKQARTSDLLDVAKTEIKTMKKGTKKYKQTKSKIQKYKRKLSQLQTEAPKELKSIVDGSHPSLDAAVNPKLSIKTVAEGLDIPKEVVSNPVKLRKFLGLDSPDIAKDFIIDGEKGYSKAMQEQLNEMSNNVRLNSNETMKYLSEKIGDNMIGNKLYDLASTDGMITKYLFNKGNLVSSENPHIAALYNWLAPDGMGRTGASKFRAIESQQKYSKVFNGGQMSMFHKHGNELYDQIKGTTGVKSSILSELNVDDYENTVVDMFKKRLIMGKEKFLEEVGDAKIAKIADNFADDFNKQNVRIIDRAKRVGVEGIDFDSTPDWFHRSWDYTKARAMKQADLEEAVENGMIRFLKDADVEFDAAKLKKQAKSFTFGIRNADITKVEGAQKGYIEFLTKLAKKSEGEAADVIGAEAKRLKVNKMKADKGDLANRVKIDINVPIKNTDLTLGDILEDNFINTQKRYNDRMAARIAAAEHGLKNLDDLDDWAADAYEAEIKRHAKAGAENPKQAAKHALKSMEQDIKAFKNGSMSGLGDLQDDNASEILRFVKKYNFASLMQYVAISSIAELGGTFVEAGVSNTLRELKRQFLPMFRRMYTKNPKIFVDQLYDDMSAFTGIGLEDFGFSTKGTSKGNRIYKKGFASELEKGVDVLSRTTRGAFGFIETTGRKVTNNTLAIQWGRHFNGTQKQGGVLEAFFGSKNVSNRVLENSNFGKFDANGKFIFNNNYEKVKKEFLKHAQYTDDGQLKNINMSKWDNDTAHMFGDVIASQSNHIFVDPDSTTMALWQSSPVGQILNQFRTFTINASTKVAAHSVGNAHMGFKRGDYAESIKLAQKLFWGSTLGMMSIIIRDNIKKAGDGQGVDMGIFDEGAMKAAALGLSRSSIIGQLPTLIDSTADAFGAEPFFEKSSSIGRSKSFFNLATTPTGQAVSKAGKGVLKLGEGEVMPLLKASPFYRQMGVQQMFNFIQKED